jgi:hypothetical protein
VYIVNKILTDDYDMLENKDHLVFLPNVIGKVDTPQWQDFVVDVIERLLATGAFELEDVWPKGCTDISDKCNDVVLIAARWVIYECYC